MNDLLSSLKLHKSFLVKARFHPNTADLKHKFRVETAER